MGLLFSFLAYTLTGVTILKEANPVSTQTTQETNLMTTMLVLGDQNISVLVIQHGPILLPRKTIS